jgi:DNA (cytosine-5)-methyltransferase 1
MVNQARAKDPEYGQRLIDKGQTLTLAAQVLNERLWPTPSASDNRDRGNRQSPAIKRRIEKGKQVMLSMSVDDASGSLNPTWVEWLMGFPEGWTDLKPSEMPLSRKSPK